MARRETDRGQHPPQMDRPTDFNPPFVAAYVAAYSCVQVPRPSLVLALEPAYRHLTMLRRLGLGPSGPRIIIAPRSKHARMEWKSQCVVTAAAGAQVRDIWSFRGRDPETALQVSERCL